MIWMIRNGPQIIINNDNLELYLKHVDQLFDISNIINAPQGKQQIVKYYTKNKLPNRLAFNREGFIHCGISYDGKHKNDDFKEQARIVEKYVRYRNARNVLELGCGMGTNSAFLAKRNPGVIFKRVDLSHKPLRRYTKIPNLHSQLGDYHDLSAFEDDAYDIGFIIDALCYSTDKLQAFHDLKRQLKRTSFLSL